MKEYIVQYDTVEIENSEYFYGGHIINELIRCKDCKHYADESCDRYADETLGYVHSTQPDFFCAVAERKEE